MGYSQIVSLVQCFLLADIGMRIHRSFPAIVRIYFTQNRLVT